MLVSKFKILRVKLSQLIYCIIDDFIMIVIDLRIKSKHYYLWLSGLYFVFVYILHLYYQLHVCICFLYTCSHFHIYSCLYLITLLITCTLNLLFHVFTVCIRNIWHVLFFFCAIVYFNPRYTFPAWTIVYY